MKPRKPDRRQLLDWYIYCYTPHGTKEDCEAPVTVFGPYDRSQCAHVLEIVHSAMHRMTLSRVELSHAPFVEAVDWEPRFSNIPEKEDRIIAGDRASRSHREESLEREHYFSDKLIERVNALCDGCKEKMARYQYMPASGTCETCDGPNKMQAVTTVPDRPRLQFRPGVTEIDWKMCEVCATWDRLKYAIAESKKIPALMARLDELGYEMPEQLDVAVLRRAGDKP